MSSLPLKYFRNEFVHVSSLLGVVVIEFVSCLSNVLLSGEVYEHGDGSLK